MKKFDKVSWIGIIVCSILLIVTMWWQGEEVKKNAALIEQAKAEEDAKKAAAAELAGSDAAASDVAVTDAPPAEPAVAAEEHILETESLKLHLTSKGAGISFAELKDHARELNGEERLTLNETAPNVIGAMSSGFDDVDESVWTVKSASAEAVTYQKVEDYGLRVEKTFRLLKDTDIDPEADQKGLARPYQIMVDVTIGNDSTNPFIFNGKSLYGGAAKPLHPDEQYFHVGYVAYGENNKFRYETTNYLGGNKVFGIFGKDEREYETFELEEMMWAGVNNQFYTILFEPLQPHESDLWLRRYLAVFDEGEDAAIKARSYAAEMGIGLPERTLNPGDQQTISYRAYIGPKEFALLRDHGNEFEEVMHYDEIPILGWMFGWIIKPLASILIFLLVMVQGWVGNFGIAIILVTIAIRLLMWPVYAKSTRSMKRMSKLAPKMKELREKYSDDPQKMNQETMKLYSTYGVNPLGGCLPILLQMPIFLAFYRMLWSAAELRHESFLWVKDLSMPDTLVEIPIPGFGTIPLNPLPILMGLTTFIQMAIAPKTGDKTQRMIFMMMPFIFLFICYNFAAALSLYWTTSNIFSILQTWLVGKMPEPELKKRADSGKKGFMQRMQEQAEAQQRMRAQGGGSSPSKANQRTKLASEKGERHTKGKKKRK